MKEEKRKKVVIIGGGFAGLSAAKLLGELPADVTLFDRKNHHTFQPLLYQVATATLSEADIAQPIRSILARYDNIKVILDNVEGFDCSAKTVRTGSGINVEYDYLIVATGATHSYFGNDAWQEHAPGLKTIEDALEIRSRILSAFENAEREMLEKGTHDPLNFIVIGAGPTGVELAGAIADTCHIYLCNDYRLIKTCNARVYLIEAAPRILLPYSEKLAEKAAQQLRELGVEILVNTKVTNIGPNLVETDKIQLKPSVTLWAAGVRASSLGKALAEELDCELDKRGCVVVDENLNPAGHPEIFVLGDLAHREQDGKPLPGVAQTAMQMGEYAARAIASDLKFATTSGISQSKRENFRYFDKGDMATIGRVKAIANIKWPFKAEWTGFAAWFSWLMIHIFFLIGLRNRLFVFTAWIWTFVSRRRGVQLITGKEHEARREDTMQKLEVETRVDKVSSR